MLHRVLQAVHTAMTTGRIIPPNPELKPAESAVSDEDLRLAEREDTVVYSPATPHGNVWVASGDSGT